MSWFSDFVENPQKSIDNALGTNFSGQGPGGFASSGDLAKWIGLQANSLQKVALAVPNAQLDLIKGDTKSAGSRFVQAYGSVGTLASGGINDFWASEGGQKFLRSTKIGSNFAGYNAGLTQSRDTGTISNDFRDETIRFGAEAAVIGSGIYAYNNPVIPTGSEAGFVSGKELVAGFSNPFTTNTVLGASAIKNLAAGNNPAKDIVKEILGDDVADIIFPSQPNNPVPSDSSDHTEFGPWQNPVYTGSSPTTAKSSNMNLTTMALVGGGIILTVLILRKISK